MAHQIAFSSTPQRTAFDQLVDYVEEERFRNIAAYIIENYEVIVSNLEFTPDTLWTALRQCKVILLGESHKDQSDRENNGHVVNLLWEPDKTAILVENRHRKDLKYARPAITAMSELWDYSTPLFFPIHMVVELKERENRALYDEFCSFLNTSKPISDSEASSSPFTAVVDEFDLAALATSKRGYLASTDEAEVAESYWEFLFPRLHRFQQKVSHYLIRRFTADVMEANQIEMSMIDFRDQLFVERVTEKLPQCSRLVTVSGEGHIWRSSPIIQHLETSGVPYLSLSTKRTYEKMKAFRESGKVVLNTMPETYKYVSKLRQCQKEWREANAEFKRSRSAPPAE